MTKFRTKYVNFQRHSVKLIFLSHFYKIYFTWCYFYSWNRLRVTHFSLAPAFECLAFTFFSCSGGINSFPNWKIFYLEPFLKTTAFAPIFTSLSQVPREQFLGLLFFTIYGKTLYNFVCFFLGDVHCI